MNLFELSDVGVRVSGGVDLLKRVNLSVPDGSYTAIVGESGSGKSTLLNLLGLLSTPTSGVLRVNGTVAAELTEMERAHLRATHFGFLFQAFHLVPYLTVLENVMLGTLYAGLSRKDRLQRSLAALETIGIGSLAAQSPLTLSGGERQRVALARAISGSPRVLLCDEPTGNLDKRTSLGVMDLFDELRSEGLSIVLVTHSPELSSRADVVHVVEDGSVRLAER